MKYSEYLQYDGLGLAELVKNKEIQAHELLEIAIQRTEKINPKLNAIVIPMYEQARCRATSTTLSGIFAGVPFLAKDLHQEFKGVQTSYGSNSFKRLRYTAKQNAEIVNRWEKAGIVNFGLTNTPELGIKGITEPDAWGSCCNPWNLKYNSGGSSGGAASAVAAGIVPIAGASDGGGSIRIPASYCGLFGLKPSRGRTPWGPDRSEIMHGAVLQHVLTKSVRDSAAMLDITHGAEKSSLFTIQAPHGSYLESIKSPPKKLKIAYSTASPIATHVSSDAIQAIEKTAKILESLGHDVVEDTPKIDGMLLAKDFITTWFSQCAYSLNYMKEHFGAKDSDFELDTLAIAALGAKSSAVDYIGNLNNWGKYTTQMNEFFEQYDLYLIPSTSSIAPRNGEVRTPTWQIPILKTLLTVGKTHLLSKGKLIEKLIKTNLEWVPFTQLANITGLPAMSVPLYWNSQNLPIGSQFVASFGREDLLLQLASQLEQAHPWFAFYPNIEI
nr:amidase family protein [Acinetobacter sp. Marseille-Q1620]